MRSRADVRAVARRHAERLAATLDDDLRHALATDALETLDGWDDIVVSRVEETAVVGRCNVAAGYHPGPPPRIAVAMSASKGRQQFSALHEYGHHLIGSDVILASEVFPSYDDGGEELEEVICDSFAAEVLLPWELVEQHIPDSGPTAQAVVDLFHDSGASREACCVRAAQRLPHAGHVMLAEGRVARFTATHNQPWRIRRGTDQGPDHLVVRAARTGRARAESRIRYGNGAESDPLWGDAVADGGYVFAVFMANSAPWQSLSLFRSSERASSETSTCRQCGWEFEIWNARRCDGCGEPPCPVHNVCWCDTRSVTERQCQTCFLTKAVSQFLGDSLECNDCAG